jgi:hypothetical protein
MQARSQTGVWERVSGEFGNEFRASLGTSSEIDEVCNFPNICHSCESRNPLFIRDAAGFLLSQEWYRILRNHKLRIE